MTKKIGIVACLCGLLVTGATALPAHAQAPVATPQPLVDSYDSLADAILALKMTEWNVIHSILAMTYRHAQGTYEQAKAQIKAGKDARAELEQLATLVAQLGNEGDASVAAIRKRLLEGGHHHHHHAGGEQKGEYDEGFVIVTRDAKKKLLDASKRIAKLSGSPDLAALESEWSKVEKTFNGLH